MSIPDTLGNLAWMTAKAPKIKELFPETWTHFSNDNLSLKVGFGLKLLGVDWRTQEQLAACLAFFERTKLIQRDGYTVRRTP